MSLLLNNWKKIQKKNQEVNNNNSNKVVGPSKPATNNSSKSIVPTIYKPNNSSGGSTSVYHGSGAAEPSKNSQYTGYGYTIGSDYGKQVAQNMSIGGTFSASDGSIWTKEKDGTITVKKDGQTYKSVYKPSDLGTLGKQQIAAGVPWQYVEQTLNDRLDKIASDPSLSQYANDGTYQLMLNYINSQKNAEEKAEYEETERDRPDDYNSDYDYRIDDILDEILNRDKFSYNAMKDPLYQQYAKMYQREGDRAMRETLAEAAAGAGGMNTYAITAAQQANNYYNSQLNDKIPELYQLAYDMYLNDIDLKVQDLGILQNMDATQYARYRDTMNDWKDDRNFAYGAYQDAIQQGNWQKSFDYNAMLDNRDFNYNDYWRNKEFEYNDMWANKEFEYNDMWANKEWNAQQADKQYERNKDAEEEAKAKLEYLISNGVTTLDPALIRQAGWTQDEINLLLAATQAQEAKSGGSSSGGSSRRSSSGSGGDGYTGDDGYEQITSTPTYTPNSDLDAGTENYQAISAACKELLAREGKTAVFNYLKEALRTGAINQSSYMTLYNKYRG